MRRAIALLGFASAALAGWATAAARSAPAARGSTVGPVRVFIPRAATASSTTTTTPAAPQQEPLAVHSSSLSQEGQQLVWRLTMARPFSAEALTKHRRTLCLLIERPRNGSVAGEACVTGPARHAHAPRLVYRPITSRGRGPAVFMSATVERSSDRALTARFLPQEVHIGYTRLRWQVISTLGSPACTPPSPNRAGCLTLYPNRPELLRLHTPIPVGCVATGPSLVFNGSRSEHEVALTFDDGPWNDPRASAFLDVLERYHAVATFFEIGEHIGSYDPGGRLERRMLSDGDLIGDHTWTHPDMTRLDYSSQRQQLVQTRDAIRAASGFHTCLWRAPYGATDAEVIALARSLRMITIAWDVDTADWSLPGTATIYQRAVNGAHNGSIILQHFGGGPRYETLDAVPEEITTLRRRGYKLVTVPQLLGLNVIYR